MREHTVARFSERSRAVSHTARDRWAWAAVCVLEPGERRTEGTPETEAPITGSFEISCQEVKLASRLPAICR